MLCKKLIALFFKFLGYRRAGLKGHIRKGVDEDLAYLAPTLIPVPGAFQADGSNPMISHTAENILFKVKKNMILGDIGEHWNCCVVHFCSQWSVLLQQEEHLLTISP